MTHVSPDLHEVLAIPEHGRTLVIMLVLFQVAAILICAKVMGWIAERIKVPGVIGELLAGVIIGPFLLGSWIHIPLHGHSVPLFPAPQEAGQWPVNDVVWSLAQFASIILLFITGLHTDLKQFLKYVGPATLIAVVGLVAPFALGAGVVYIPGFAELARATPGESVLIPALFVGAILAATSIGITARVLGDINMLDTPEGVTILGAAVLDDVLGIIALAIVGGMASAVTASAAGDAHGSISLIQIGGIAGKAFGVWIGITVIVLLLSRWIERALDGIRYAGAVVALGLALAFICSAIAEFFGLAFIIGAYSVGLGLSQRKIAQRLMDELHSIANFIVPIFFATLGMLVNLDAMFANWRVVVFGLVVTAAAIVGKLLGCGLAALPTGFNGRGAYRIGLGMLPRGEVALIVAGIGLSRNMIGQNVFGVSIMMTLITTIVAPILLVPAFRSGGSGRRVSDETSKKLPQFSPDPPLAIRLPPDLIEPVIARLIQAAETRGWKGAYETSDEEMHLLRNGPDAAQIRSVDGEIHIDASGKCQQDFDEMWAQVKSSICKDVETKVSRVEKT